MVAGIGVEPAMVEGDVELGGRGRQTGVGVGLVGDVEGEMGTVIMGVRMVREVERGFEELLLLLLLL